MAKEDVAVGAVGQERFQSIGPGAQLIGRVGGSPQPQVDVVRRSSKVGLLAIVEIGGAQRRVVGLQRAEDLIVMPARMLELDCQGEVGRPDRQQGCELFVVAHDLLGDAIKHAAEPIPKGAIRAGQPVDGLLCGRSESAQAAPTLSLDDEAEVDWSGGEPCGYAFRLGLLVEGVVQLDRR